MKKPQLQPLILMTVLFIGLIGGYFLGSNLNHSIIQPEGFRLDVQQPYTLSPEIQESLTCNYHTGPININSATKEELLTLPGVGEVLAQRIVDYRRQNGSFSTVYELTKVDGFGEKRLDAILDMITVGG